MNLCKTKHDWLCFLVFSFFIIENAKIFNDPKKHEIHLSAKQEYPAAERLPLPHNIDPTESTRFSPNRARDITSSAIATDIWNRFDVTVDATYDKINQSDLHVNSYDCNGAVNLNSSMQSNVPTPFGGMHKFTHLNMPGGQWEQGSKWLSHDLNSSHYTHLRREARKNWINGSTNDRNNNKGTNCNQPKHEHILNALNALNNNNNNNLLCAHINVNRCMIVTKRNLSNSSNVGGQHLDKIENNNNSKRNEALSGKDKLKKAVKDYGVTVIVFHITISLASLGFFYQLVAR